MGGDWKDIKRSGGIKQLREGVEFGIKLERLLKGK